jgi:ornithine lipid ester-linked acyl 2-hydroxylase
MKDIKEDLQSPGPSIGEDIQRGWYWVVFAIKTLSRVGGIGAWSRTVKQVVGILYSRMVTQRKYELAQRQATKETVAPEQQLAKAIVNKTSFFAATQFPFTQELENNWQKIYHELAGLHGEHFIDWSERYLYKDGWTTFGLYGFGIKIEKNCQLCPETTKLLEQIPTLVTAGFSSLRPGTSIAPHTGYPDGVLRCHLGLIIPGNECGIRVGAETRHWEVGKCLVFDDTLEHEAWNKSDRTRIVLLLDFKP